MEVEWIFRAEGRYVLSGRGTVLSGRIIYSETKEIEPRGQTVTFLYGLDVYRDLICKNVERYCVGGKSAWNIVGLLFEEDVKLETNQVILRKKDG